MKKLVSILIPNYNKAPYLRETLDSVLAQTYTHWECIIVDDHSKDNSWEILEEYASLDPRFKIYRRPADRKPGGNAARNYAFEMSQGVYVNYFDSDDLMSKDLLLNRVNVINDDEANVDLVAGNGRRFVHSIDDTDIFISPLFNLDFFIDGYFKYNPPLMSQSCLISRNFLLINNIFWDENVKGLQDVDFCLNVSLYASSVHLIKNVDWHWRIIKNGQSVGGLSFELKNSDSLLYLILKFREISMKFNEHLFPQFLYRTFIKLRFKISLMLFLKFILPTYKLNLISNRSFAYFIFLTIQSYFLKKRSVTGFYKYCSSFIITNGEILFEHGQILENYEDCLKTIFENKSEYTYRNIYNNLISITID